MFEISPSTATVPSYGEISVILITGSLIFALLPNIKNGLSFLPLSSFFDSPFESPWLNEPLLE